MYEREQLVRDLRVWVYVVMEYRRLGWAYQYAKTYNEEVFPRLLRLFELEDMKRRYPTVFPYQAGSPNRRERPGCNREKLQFGLSYFETRPDT